MGWDGGVHGISNVLVLVWVSILLLCLECVTWNTLGIFVHASKSTCCQCLTPACEPFVPSLIEGWGQGRGPLRPYLRTLQSSLGNTFGAVGEVRAPGSPIWHLPPQTRQPPPRLPRRPAGCRCSGHSCAAPERPTWRERRGDTLPVQGQARSQSTT